MKTAVSIDDRVYRRAEHTAGLMGMTRSKFYTLAVEEYIQNHAPEFLLNRLNAVYTGENTKIDDDIYEAQFRLLSGEDW